MDAYVHGHVRRRPGYLLSPGKLMWGLDPLYLIVTVAGWLVLWLIGNGERKR
jgi:hypothetical protein